MSRVVVIGNGMAGARFTSEVRSLDPRCHVTVFGAEPTAAYNRVLLSELLAGKVEEDDIALAEPAGVVDRRDGTSVVEIDRAAGVVVADDGTRTRYDALVLATGSTPFVPPIDGLARPGGALVDGAALFRNVEDCRRILSIAEDAKRAVVLGGGLLGLEAARGLALRGLEVEILHARRQLMERQLDPDASRVLTGTLRELGVTVRLSAVTDEVVTDAADRLCAVRLDDGTEIAADLLVIACGVLPDTSLARGAGLDLGRGVIVDDLMRTSDPAIYAIGDCAEHRGTVYGLVAPAWDQAKVAAGAVGGAATAYTGSRVVTRLKAAGVDLASMGDPHIDAETDATAEVVTFADPARSTYQKVVIRDRRLVGAIMIGDNPTVGAVTQLFDRDAPVPGDPRSLLFEAAGAESAPVAAMPAGTTVCRCNGVSAGSIVRAWLGGARSVPAVAAETRASTGCGSCRDTIEGFVAHLCAEVSTPTGEVVA